MAELSVVLKSGKEKPLRNRHPWVYSGAIARSEGNATVGAVAEVYNSEGRWLARGFFNSQSQLRVRLFSWHEGDTVDTHFWRKRLQRAVLGRADLFAAKDTDTFRVVYGEADGVPGWVCDRYGDWLVAQVSTAGAERIKRELAQHMLALTGLRGVLERSDPGVRRKEGLPTENGLLAGTEPPPRLTVQENGFRFYVDLQSAQKTGFYLDQRVNRALTRTVSAGAQVLNGFSYTGAFAAYALAGGASHVTNLDSERSVLELAAENLALNGLGAAGERWDNIQGDAFQVLRTWRSEQRRFDLIILDPPKFAANAEQVQAATRGYKDINLIAMQLLNPGGLLLTFSCSGLVTPDLFQKVVFGASVDAGRDVQILAHLSQSPDHPILLSFPESEYLKGLMCRVW